MIFNVLIDRIYYVHYIEFTHPNSHETCEKTISYIILLKLYNRKDLYASLFKMGHFLVYIRTSIKLRLRFWLYYKRKSKEIIMKQVYKVVDKKYAILCNPLLITLKMVYSQGKIR